MFSIRNDFLRNVNIFKNLNSIKSLTNCVKNDLILMKLKSKLGETNVSTAQSVREQHGKDEGFYGSAPPDIVVFAQNTKHVTQVHRLCYEYEIPIIPYGTGTGLEGGVNAINGGVCIDLSNMNKVIEVNKEDFDCTVEAGIDWRSLNEYLRDTGLQFPIDPGASASIGGMTATSASGTNAVAFGTMRRNVLNLEVVLPNGQMIHTSGRNCRSRKSSAGYDLTSIFIGSEGTLGTITKIYLKLSAVPNLVALGVCSFPDDRSAIDSVIEILQSNIPVARVEYLDKTSIEACRAYSQIDLPLSPTLFLELNGSTTEELNQRGIAVKSISKSKGGTNFEYSSNPNERKRIWKARHELYYAYKAFKPNSTAITTDVCVPISRLTEMILRSKQLIESQDIIGTFCGHVGDGNFHTYLYFDPKSDEEFARVKYVAHSMGQMAIELCGTCSGEHGIGREKINLLLEQYGSPAIELMKSLKKIIDPKNLMNPQKLF